WCLKSNSSQTNRHATPNHLSRPGPLRGTRRTCRRAHPETRGIPSQDHALSRGDRRDRPPQAQGQPVRSAHRPARAGARDRHPRAAPGRLYGVGRGLRPDDPPARGRHPDPARRGEAPRRNPRQRGLNMKPQRSAPYLPKRDAGVKSANDEDPYRSTTKPPEGTECPKCHAAFVNGRWAWEKGSDDAPQMVCPACQRIEDRFPAGYVTIKGSYFADHRDEIIALVQNHEKKEKAN